VVGKNLIFTNGAGHMAPTGETRNTQRVLVRKSERRRRRKWKDNINIMGGGGVNLCGPGEGKWCAVLKGGGGGMQHCLA
jgi:hypothetical protein